MLHHNLLPKENDMGELTLAYKARSYSTGTLGRAICNARTHHWVADDAGGEEIGAGELFFSGISACAVNMVERLANADHIPLDWMDVSVEAYRDPDKPQADLTLYDAIRIHFEMWGVADEHAEGLVETWKRR
jgi:uncharacterized OsmC-like protein